MELSVNSCFGAVATSEFQPCYCGRKEGQRTSSPQENLYQDKPDPFRALPYSSWKRICHLLQTWPGHGGIKCDATGDPGNWQSMRNSRKFYRSKPVAFFAQSGAFGSTMYNLQKLGNNQINQTGKPIHEQNIPEAS